MVTICTDINFTRTMREKLIHAFPSLTAVDLSDDYIASHPDLMWDIPPIPLIRAVPLYMLWCVEHEQEEGELVFGYTIAALNKYSRATSPNIEWQNFRFSLTTEQIDAVKLFLHWCESTLKQNYEPMLSRAIKNWGGFS